MQIEFCPESSVSLSKLKSSSVLTNNSTSFLDFSFELRPRATNIILQEAIQHNEWSDQYEVVVNLILISDLIYKLKSE